MNSDDIRALIKIRLDQADECLEVARSILTLERGNRSVINRAYYAAFYAALALLQIQEQTTKKHIGLISLFDMEFVKTGKLPKQLSKWLHQLFDVRMEDDYQNISLISKEEAESALEIAEQFVETIRTYLHKEGYFEV